MASKDLNELIDKYSISLRDIVNVHFIKSLSFNLIAFVAPKEGRKKEWHPQINFRITKEVFSVL